VNEAYRRITAAPEPDRRDLFVSAARRVGITEQNAEKDFWVCWTLDALFHGRPPDAPRLLFKGGTSLSKAFGLINRFSEDIAITVFRQDLGEPISIEDLERLCGKKRNAKLDEILDACRQYLKDGLQPELDRRLAEAVGGTPARGIAVRFDDADPDGQTLLVRYPTVLAPDGYVRAEVRIECGAKSALDPHVSASVRPYVADELPAIDLAVSDVTTIQPTRTFWDKVVIVHGLRAWFDRRGELRQEGQRISRHYYDLHALSASGLGEQAIADRLLGAECVRHAQMFFGRPDYNLPAAVPGTYRLTPTGSMVDALRRDYQAMVGMIIGTAPDFDAILASVAMLEDQLNR
jgi:hypothetical protein